MAFYIPEIAYRSTLYVCWQCAVNDVSFHIRSREYIGVVFQDCDRIFVMDQGRVAEEGNYRELMEQGGLFCQLAG